MAYYDDDDDGEYYSTYKLNPAEAKRRNEQARQDMLHFSNAEEKDIVALLNKHLKDFKVLYDEYIASTAGKLRTLRLKMKECSKQYSLAKDNAILNQIKVNSYREYVKYFNSIESIYDSYERNLNWLKNKSEIDDRKIKVVIGDSSKHIFYLDQIEYWQTYLKYAPKYATSLQKAQRFLQSYEKKALSYKNGLDNLVSTYLNSKNKREELKKLFNTEKEQEIYKNLNGRYRVLMQGIYNDCAPKLNLYLKHANKTPLKEQINKTLEKNKGKSNELVCLNSLFGLYSSIATNELQLQNNKTEEKGS